MQAWQPQYDEKLLKNLLRAWRRLRMNWCMLNWVRKKWCMSVQRQAGDIEEKKHPENCRGCLVHFLAINRSCNVLNCRQLQKVTGHQIIASWPLSLFLTLSTAIYLCICLCHRSCLTPQPQPTLTLNPQLEIISKVWIRRYLATLASVFIGGMLDTLGISGPNF